MKTENVLVRMSEKDKELLRRRAEEEQMSMSEYIINLIRIDAQKALM